MIFSLVLKAYPFIKEYRKESYLNKIETFRNGLKVNLLNIENMQKFLIL